jgi:hypothetical protein
VSSFSCGDFLDVNQNPNKATSSTPELVLPQAIVYTARNIVRFNNYGASQAGYYVNAGGYGGWGSFITYNFTTSDYAGLWSDTYDNLMDIQYVIDNSVGKEEYTYFEAAARILKSFNFQMLVDTYNDVPYTEALKGASNLNAKYDKAEDIYKALADDIDAALKLMNSGKAVPTSFGTAADPLFGGNVTKWKQFANTIKLRLIIRAGNKVAFTNKTFDGAGFLTADAIVNPGYSKQDGKQNPAWDYYMFDYSGANRGAGLQYMPSDFILAFYNGHKLDDEVRGYATFRSFPSTPTNQLGYTKSDAPSVSSPSSWYIGSGVDGATNGIFKGYTAGQPLMLAAESWFLQAEASLTGLVAGNTETQFNNGIKASISYLYADASGAVSEDVEGDFEYYVDANAGNYLVDFAAATTDEEKLEAIITQKYIANNMVNSFEGWNEYRRTHYPAIVNGSTDSEETFASIETTSTRPDKLPARIPYPNSEYQYNDANVPQDINVFSSNIFWAK